MSTLRLQIVAALLAFLHFHIENVVKSQKCGRNISNAIPCSMDPFILRIQMFACVRRLVRRCFSYRSSKSSHTNFSFHLYNEIKSTPKLLNTHSSADTQPFGIWLERPIATTRNNNMNLHWHHLYFSVVVSMIGVDFNARTVCYRFENVRSIRTRYTSIVCESVSPDKCIWCTCVCLSTASPCTAVHMYLSYSPVNKREPENECESEDWTKQILWRIGRALAFKTL